LIKVKLKKEVVRLALARKNLTQNELARRLGISSGYMSQIMTGYRHPSAAVRRLILRHLRGCSFDDLFEVEYCQINERTI
jgi:putative transcriptional regulator